MIELQRHFGDTAVQFPKDYLNLIEAMFDKASVCPRNIMLASLPVCTENISRARTKF